MPYLTANGTTCIRGKVVMPRTGLWWADLEIQDQDPTPYEGKVTLAFNEGAFTLQGASLPARLAPQWGVVMCRVVGGAAGLATQLPAKAYQSVTFQLPFLDLLGACGEAASPIADPSTLKLPLQFWNRLAGTGARALGALVDPLGLPWRALPDGTIWVGPETYPDSGLTNYVITDTAPQENALELKIDTPSIFPGESFQGNEVSRLEHHIETHQIRTRLWFEDQP